MIERQSSRTIKMVYSGRLEYISCATDTKYEDILETAVERFDIPDDFKDFIQISNESRYIFSKDTFEYFNLLFPNSEIIFYIRVDYSGLLDNLRNESRKPFTSLSNKRKSRDEEDVGVPVTRQNCFIGSLPESEPSERNQHKRSRIDYDLLKSTSAVVKKSSSRQSIRI